MELYHDLKFFVNGKYCEVSACEFLPTTTLNSFLRNQLHLTGTKRMCLEGGCGACIVAIKRKNAVTKEAEVVAVNSCLVSIFSICGWEIYTIEGLGNSDKPNKLQDVITKFHGTQCGYCTPGMIMNMFALKQNKKDVKMEEVENSFGGNICRCTGYRSILAAFKSVCCDASADLLKRCGDIEDLPICPKTLNNMESINKIDLASSYYYKFRGISWIKVTFFNDLLEIIKTFNSIKNGDQTYYAIVAGNTSQGVYKTKTNYNVYVDVQDVLELKNNRIIESSLCIGANTTLTNALDLFVRMAKEQPQLKYLKKLADHIDLIANVPVRNVGTIAGNLMIKHKNNDFPSDIFLLLETIEATLEIIDVNGKQVFVKPCEFLKINMENRLIKKIYFPYLSEDYYFESYKIMRRSQNTHASLNAAFLLRISKKNVVEEARIVVGSLSSKLHASETEQLITGKNIFNTDVLQMAFKSLDNEINPEFDLMHPKPEYSKKSIISLFYKYILSITPDQLLSPQNISGKFKLNRPISTGQQIYESKESMYPISYPAKKVEAIFQATGEAEFISDMPDLPEQLYAAFVLCKTKPLSEIVKIDTGKAMQLNGVVAFFDKNDIPGRNTFTPIKIGTPTSHPVEEELFCSGVVQYHSQPLGIVVATSQGIAEEAADLIKVVYKKGKETPVFSVQDVLNNNRTDRIRADRTDPLIKEDHNNLHTIKGRVNLNWQSHFYMETQCCNVIYKESGLDIYSSTQWMDCVEIAASVALNIPSSKINVAVKRIGGAFGGKIVRNSMVSTACALASYKLKKPVKLWLPIEYNFAIIGKRNPVLSNYEVAVNDEGEIEYINNSFYVNHGKGGNEDVLAFTYFTFGSTYAEDKWHINGYAVTTDMHASTYMRSPGVAEGITMIECIMEQAAISHGIDSLKFRKINLNKSDLKILEYFNELIQWADIDRRKEGIAIFNKNNCWRKKGLSVVPLKYPMEILFNYGVIVSIYHSDGSVAISHGGVEIGQGINTKAIQTCAYKLGIPMEKITVKSSNNLVGANSGMTGASLASEGVCWAVAYCCETLLERMDPIKATMNNPTWEELVEESHKMRVNLVCHSHYSSNSPGIRNYEIYGACATEIELDVLTGQHHIARVDILEDVGDTMNPEIDIGQIEGAFIMGIGFFTTENIIVDENGEILTNRTWNYTPPGAKDIPIDFRIKLPGRNPNPVGVMKSKAVGEIAFNLAITVPLAIRNAVASVRQYFDESASLWYPIDGPSTVEDTFINCIHNYEKYTL